MLRGLWFTHREWKHKICHHNVIFLLHVKTVVYSKPSSVFPFKRRRTSIQAFKNHPQWTFFAIECCTLWGFYSEVLKNSVHQIFPTGSLSTRVHCLSDCERHSLHFWKESPHVVPTKTRIKIHPFCLRCNAMLHSSLQLVLLHVSLCPSMVVNPPQTDLPNWINSD